MAFDSARLAQLALCLAAEAGQFEEVRKRLESGVSVNCRNERQLTPLVLSVHNPNAIRVTGYLLDHGAEVDAEIPDLKMTALHVACKDQNIEGAKLLLQHGANPELIDFNGRTVLHYAAAGTSTKLLEKLIKRTKGSFINAADDSGYTPLMVACEQGRLELVRILLDNSADPALRNRLHHQALELADWFGHRKVVEELETWMRSRGMLPLGSSGITEPAVPPSPATAFGTPVPLLMSPVATPVAHGSEASTYGSEGTHGAGASDPIGVALQNAASTVPFGGGLPTLTSP